MHAIGRRAVLGSIIGWSATATIARADNNCYPTGCIAEVPLTAFSQIYAQQQQSQWCWAAAIQMLFAASGRRLSQRRIVETAYGGAINLPAFNPATIAALTNRSWVSDDGDRFRASLVAAYDAFAGVTAINNDVIVRALANNQPMIVCNRSHAMLLTAVAYVPTPYGPSINNVGFFDPWPGRGARGPDRPGEIATANNGGELTYIGLCDIT